MKKSTKNLLRSLETKQDRRLAIVRKYLQRYNIRVGEWYPHWQSKKHPITYQACFETRRVFIPIPVDNYSFYICMHEIGHIVTGESWYGWQQEWKAEQWSLKKCIQYGYYRKWYEDEAKRYVLRVMYEDIIFRGFNINATPIRVMRWMGRDEKRVRSGAIRWINKWSKSDALTVDPKDYKECVRGPEHLVLA